MTLTLIHCGSRRPPFGLRSAASSTSNWLLPRCVSVPRCCCSSLPISKERYCCRLSWQRQSSERRSVKYNHSGLKLTVTDLPLAFAGTVPFFIVQYPLAAIAVLAWRHRAHSGRSRGSALRAWAASFFGTPGSLARHCIYWFGSSIQGKRRGRFFPADRGPAAVFFFDLHSLPSQPAFLATVRRLDSERHRQRPLAADGGRTSAHPRLSRHYRHPARIRSSIRACYGLPVEPIVEAFLSPKNGLYGSLNIDIFGGGSWQSEFSLLTGLSSASFGSNAYFLFKRGVGRFHSSLPQTLAGLGYKTIARFELPPQFSQLRCFLPLDRC